MKLLNSRAQLPKSMAPALLALAVALSGCGGSSSGGGDASGGNGTGSNNGGDPDGNNGTSSVVVHRISLTGLAIDPYIASANLCADLNLNKRCDEREPRGTTSEAGEFNLGDWPDGYDKVQILVENQGSWQVPQYGLHDGKPYGMPMGIMIPRDVEVASKSSPLPPVLMTPATTLQANYGLTEDQVLAIVNQFKTQIGREITEKDLQTDPVSLFGKTPVADLKNDDLAVFRVYLALYAVNRILSSLESLNAGLGQQFSQRLTDSQSAEYKVLKITLDSIARATATNVLSASQQQINTGQQQMDDGIRAGVTAAGMGAFADVVLADVPDFPALTADVVMAVGVTIIEFELSRTHGLVTELFNAGGRTFDQIAQAAADQLEADFQDGGSGHQLEGHIPVLGVRTYGLINKERFLAYQSYSYQPPVGNAIPLGAQIYNGILNANADLVMGLNCESAGFFAFADNTNGSDVIDTRCTSALPTNLQQKLANFSGSAQPPTAENSPVDQNVWANIPAGSLLVSDLPANQSCNLSGTVYWTPPNSSTIVPAANVPLYLTYGAEKREINVKTDASGQFRFNRVPAKKYVADGWSAAEANGDDHYFFGVIAGKRRPVPEYYEYEANADYFFNCRLPVGGGAAGTGGEGSRDGEGNLVFAPADIEAYPLIKPLVGGTRLEGVFPVEMVGSGFAMEVHSKLRTYDSTSTSTSGSVYGGGWIMDSVQLQTPQQQHPFTEYVAATRRFSVSALAGGVYTLRPFFPVNETDASGQSVEYKVECDSQEITVNKGQVAHANMTLENVVGSEQSNCYYVQGKSGQYKKKLVISSP